MAYHAGYLERSDASGEETDRGMRFVVENYLAILQESLEKKEQVLIRISKKNAAQRLILLEESLDEEAFEENVDGKTALIEELLQLDSGFEQVYKRVEQELSIHKDTYREEIRSLQELISRITELSAQLRVQEERNKELARQKFAETRAKIRTVKTGRQVASRYYKTMSKVNYVDPQFMDSKK
ncbi:hypothetical protein FACS1894111_05140 [Clostridia bacterium]|nr:hypothetical protein FACS1894111_05140 [Clostridia bacterium]